MHDTMTPLPDQSAAPHNGVRGSPALGQLQNAANQLRHVGRRRGSVQRQLGAGQGQAQLTGQRRIRARLDDGAGELHATGSGIDHMRDHNAAG